MDKKIAKNVSSGAKKVERVEAEKEYTADSVNANAASKPVKKTAPKKTAKPTDTPSKSAKSQKAERAKKKERAAADKRIEAAKKRAQKKEEKLMRRAKLKEKKLEKKAALKAKKIEKRAALKEKKANRIQARQERRAALKEKRVERRAEKAARRELLKHEGKAEKQKRLAREKKERSALRRQKQESRDAARAARAEAREKQRARKAEHKKDKRRRRAEHKKRSQGFGGWLAAVVSLGVACLALATVVTAGAIRMRDVNSEVESGYRSTLFEMVSVSEDMDDSLSKLSVSSGADEQRRLLTDLLVNSSLMESALERVPVDAATGTDISAFVNRTASYAKRLLGELAQGKQLTEMEKNTISYLSQVNHTLYGELNDIVMNMKDKDFRAFLEGKKSEVGNKFSQAGKDTHLNPDTAVDTPFSVQGNVGKNRLEQFEEVTAERAEELVKGYFSTYHIADTRMTGETEARGTQCYNFVMTDENGTEIYAEISKNGGKLMFFDTYEPCTQKNFDLEACDSLAREYLATLGIDDVEAAFTSDTGMVANITYVGVVNGVRVYPEAIRVRVCESKGRVIGIDAADYLFNHFERKIPQAQMSEREARDMLSGSLTPYEVHLALIANQGKETLVYEYACYTENETYLVYLDANTGNEVQMYRIRESSGGKYLR